MKAVVFHGIGDIRLEDVAKPRIEQPTDAIVRLAASAMCGTDFHVVRGTASGAKPGAILGHEGGGIVEQLGTMVRNLEIGDRVVIPSTIARGTCSCRQVDPAEIQTNAEPLSGAIEAYEPFDRRDPGWIKVEFVPARAAE
jgi:threonine dehydrogenase-like Zn-dependent dehydrogenase